MLLQTFKRIHMLAGRSERRTGPGFPGPFSFGRIGLRRLRRRELASGREACQLTKRGEPRERLAFELADALARQVELVADRLERPRLALEAEPQLEDPPLALRERVECLADVLATQRLLGLVERVDGVAVGEQVAQLALVVGADRLVERDGGRRGGERLVDVLDRQARRFRELVLRRLAPELDLEPPCRARQLLLALDDVDRDADRA